MLFWSTASAALTEEEGHDEVKGCVWTNWQLQIEKYDKYIYLPFIF